VEPPISGVYNYERELQYYLRHIDESEKIDGSTRQKVSDFLAHISAGERAQVGKRSMPVTF
jgi:hypothetical protein